jgi:hypothetical protein
MTAPARGLNTPQRRYKVSNDQNGISVQRAECCMDSIRDSGLP